MHAVLAFGDSITFGRGVVPSRGWTNSLKEYFESKDFYNVLYNLGIPGDSSTDLLKRFETEAKARIQYYFPDKK
ncbi:MAG: SGNH/GDSL hydrolase family protein [Nanobdellota archaeon]